MATDPTNPLTDEHRAAIEDSLSQLDTAQAIIDRAKLAGFDVSAEEAETKRLREQALGIKRAFFPTGAKSTRRT